ncbi:MAG TPA: polysaccharide deacetylase [Marmoricola sp.]|nr:polysaccharide deacetylase [Marmoricola sp.]
MTGRPAEPGPQPAGPVTWPRGYRAAASFSFDVDAESAVLSAVPGSQARAGIMSHQSYGPLVGVPRILEILRRHRVTATFFVPGFTAERYPDVVRQIVAAGHEIAHHGYLHEPLEGVDAETEAGYLDRGLEALERVAGVRPVGYRAPMWEPTWNTPRLLAERGFLYDSSLMDADVPYELAVEGVGDTGSIVEIPIQWALDDWEQYCFLPGVSGEGLIESPAKVEEMWTLELDAMREVGGCFALTNHPFLTGRPSRAAVLDRLIGRAADHGDLWLASLGQIAEHVRGLRLAARTIVPPQPDAG